MAQAAPDQLSRHTHAPVVSHVPCPEQTIPSLVSPAQTVWHITPAKQKGLGFRVCLAHNSCQTTCPSTSASTRYSERRERGCHYSQGVSVCANVCVRTHFFTSSIVSGHA